MNTLFGSIAGVVTRKPVAALALLALVTIALASGMGLRLPQAGNDVFLPAGSEVANASDTLSESFPDTADLSNITVLHRGEFLSPEGLNQIDNVVDAALVDPGVQERLALTNPVVSVAGAFKQALGVQDLSGVTQQQIDAVAADPQIAALVENLSGQADGEPLVISSLKLRSLGDSDAMEDVELLVADAVETVDGPLSVRSMSAATRSLDSAEASPSMGTLMMGALLVIAVLLLLFFRSGSDVALSLAGLAITIVGTLGFEGLAGPDGLGLIGPPNSLTSMVPIMMVGLVVDYSIQTVAKYRELRANGLAVVDATRGALQGVALPLGLAAGTTIISFLTNLTSSIPANGDFGVVAAFGVFFGLFTMLILIPAARSLFDRRREAAGKLGDAKQMTDAIPGAGAFVERIGRLVAAKPMVVLAVAGIITIGLGTAATQISTEFDSNDFLPSGSDSIEDIEAVNEALGGETVLTTTLIEAELTDDRTLRNLLTLSESFGDELSRPTGAAGDITLSLGALFSDWFNESGQPGDNYDPELVELAQGVDQGLTVDPAGVQALLDRLEEVDPVGFAQVAVNNPDGEDLTLVQFNAFTGDQDLTVQMVDDLEGLWFGDRDQITATSGDITALEITSAMTDGQSTSIAITLLAALIVLMIFFWITEFKPMLGFIAVSPILLVLLWVLGTMTLLGIPYNVVTALITALSIGIGVDYTIHIIHRFTEELEHGKSLIDATTTTLSTTGSALIGSALTTALAFAVLLLSPQLPFQQFGLVTGITILYALIMSIVVVPPMLIVWAAYHQWRAGMEH
ncbi:MAG: MMPL family transporter [Acidimicrobiia bacterium]|nr:MMPL family transporter [Acidimicrobiia bacterium]